MQNRDDKYIEQPDDFSKKIKQKLDNHRMPVDIDCWDAIEAQIKPVAQNNVNSKKIVLRWASSIAAIAAMIALVIFFMPDNKPLSEMAVIHQDTNEPHTVNEPVHHPTKEAPAQIQGEKALAVQVVQNNQEPLALRANATKIEDENTSFETNSTDQKETNNSLVNNEPEETSDDPEKEVQSTQTKKNTSRQHERPVLLGARAKDKNDKWLLAASFSSGSSSVTDAKTFSTLKNYTQNDAENPVTVKDPGEANSRKLADDDFTDSDHSIPLSFGISVRKDFNKYIGLETGLTYTYLSSTFERVNIPQYKSKRELHYLGIPVNLVVYLWNDPKWNVYVSGGVMLEKGLSQKYVQDMYQNNVKISSTTDKGSVNGVQWSLNAAAGISYSIYQDLSLYAEPRFSHYFENDQPASIRTEKSNVVSLGGGLRYKF